ncbi:MAG: helix-turn-helix transcriptional regulator [Acidiferrobacter sp.]
MDTDWPHQIRRQRIALRLTQQQLADRAHVTRKTISVLESPTQRGAVSLSLLERVAGILGLAMTLTPVSKPTLDELLQQNTWEGGPPSEPRRRVRHGRRSVNRLPPNKEGAASFEGKGDKPAPGKPIPAGRASDDGDGGGRAS